MPAPDINKLKQLTTFSHLSGNVAHRRWVRHMVIQIGLPNSTALEMQGHRLPWGLSHTKSLRLTNADVGSPDALELQKEKQDWLKTYFMHWIIVYSRNRAQQSS